MDDTQIAGRAPVATGTVIRPLPCPFCGADAVIQHVRLSQQVLFGPDYFEVGCPKCAEIQIEGDTDTAARRAFVHATSPVAAVQAWNVRDQAAAQQLLDTLETLTPEQEDSAP